MASTHYRPRGSGYTVAGTSALAQPRYYENESRSPAYELRVPARPPMARRGQERRRGIRAATMAVTLGMVFAVLAGISLSKAAVTSGLQGQINQAQSNIRMLQNENQALEERLTVSTDGELIRNYAVNELGLLRITADAIRPIRMLDTRPMGDARATDVQMRQEGGGFIAVLANLLRQIPL